MDTPEQDRDIFKLSDEELQILGRDPAQAEQIRRILLEGINEMRYEIDRMERFLESFLVRGATLMTVGGLISLLPLGIDTNSVLFVKHYLIWIFPFLLIAILAFIKSSAGAHTYRTHFSSYSKGAAGELLGLRVISRSTLDIWQELYKKFQRTLRWHRINSIAIMLFLFWYTTNFYLFIFFRLPSLERMVISTILLFLLGALMYFSNILASYTKSWTKDGQIINRKVPGKLTGSEE